MLPAASLTVLWAVLFVSGRVSTTVTHDCTGGISQALFECIDMRSLYITDRPQVHMPRPHYSPKAIYISLLLLLGGIESNPGPSAGSAIAMGCLNAHSIVRKGSLILDIIESHQIDALAICESFVVDEDPEAIKMAAAPTGFKVLHVPRPSATVRNRGGGLCFIHRESIVVKSHPLQQSLRYTSFECLLVNLHIGSSNSKDGSSTVAIIYRPPSSCISTFYDELSDLFDKVADEIDSDRFIACGDANCGGANSSTVCDELSTLLDSHGLRQHVVTATRQTSTVCSLLDVVMVNDSSKRLSQLAVTPTHGVSDHDLITWSWTSQARLPRRFITYCFRNLKSVDWSLFKDDVQRSALFSSPAGTANDFAIQLDETVATILDRHCPIQERSKFESKRRDSRWLSADAMEAKRNRRRLERKWKSSRSNADFIEYRKACRTANKSIISSRTDFYRQRIHEAGNNPRTRWSAFRDVLHLASTTESRSKRDCIRLCNKFATYFTEKIHKLKILIRSQLADTSADPLQI